MSSIHQPCPECGRNLELPVHAAGKTARCPACEATFDVPVGASDQSTGGPPDATIPQTFSSTPDSNPLTEGYSVPPHGNSSVPPPDSLNPYQPSSSTPSTVTIGEFTVQDVSIEDILAMSWAVFKDRWVNLLLSMLIVVGVSMLIGGIVIAFILGGAALTGTMANGNQINLAAIAGIGLGLLILTPLALFASAYLWTGFGRTILAIAQGHSSPLGEMLPPIKIVWKMIASSLVIAAIFMGIFMLFGIFFAILGAAVDPQVAGIGAGIVGMLSQLIVQFAYQMLLWPWLYMICQGRSTVLGAVTDSFRIAMHNKATSAILVLASIGLSMAGAMMCYVGLLITMPTSMLIFGVGYLMITSQPVSDPREVNYLPQNPLNPS